MRIRRPLNLAEKHLATERAMQASGIPYTILRNGWYTENYTGSIPGAVAGGALLGSAGTGPDFVGRSSRLSRKRQ